MLMEVNYESLGTRFAPPSDKVWIRHCYDKLSQKPYRKFLPEMKEIRKTKILQLTVLYMLLYLFTTFDTDTSSSIVISCCLWMITADC